MKGPGRVFFVRPDSFIASLLWDFYLVISVRSPRSPLPDFADPPPLRHPHPPSLAVPLTSPHASSLRLLPRLYPSPLASCPTSPLASPILKGDGGLVHAVRHRLRWDDAHVVRFDLHQGAKGITPCHPRTHTHPAALLREAHPPVPLATRPHPMYVDRDRPTTCPSPPSRSTGSGSSTLSGHAALCSSLRGTGPPHTTSGPG